MDIERKRGDSYADEFTITYKETGVPVNLAGCTFLLSLDTLASPPDGTTQVYQLTGVVSDPTKGVVGFSPTTTQADKVGYYYFDVQMTDATGAVRTIASGRYVYKQDITK